MLQAAQRNTTVPAQSRKAAAQQAAATDAIAFLSLRCTRCGGAEVCAVAPGEAEDRCDLFLLRAEVPARAFCERC